MSRESHHAKNLDERKDYFNTVIRGPGPTMEVESSIIDSTDSVTPEEKAALYFHPTKRRLAFWIYLWERKIILTLITIALPIFGWAGVQLYSLNREVGVINTNIENNEKLQKDLQSQIEKTEKRITEQIKAVSSDVERLERRVDIIVDHKYQKEKTQR